MIATHRQKYRLGANAGAVDFYEEKGHMNKQDKNSAGKDRRKGRATNLALILLQAALAGVVLFCLGKIGYAFLQYKAGQDAYDAIRTETAGDPADAGVAQADETESKVDFAALQEKYPQAVGWLSSAGTNIDYPVMQASDNDYFLRRLPSGEWNMSGSLFLDYQCAPDFSDDLSVIYGHNMDDGSMFASLENYAMQAWYDDHPVMELVTGQGTATLDVLYGFTIPAQTWVDRGFGSAANRQDLLEYASGHTTFTAQDQWDGEAALVALVTCEERNDQNRYVLLCAFS